MYTFGFFGCGNMGSALARAAAKSVGGEQVILSDLSKERLAQLSAELGAVAAQNNAEVANSARFLFLGVKPQMMQELLTELSPLLIARKERFVLVTMAAGLSIEAITKMVGAEYPVIRIMPNTSASIGQAMIIYAANALVTAEELEEFCAKMQTAGRLDPLPEHLIDAGACISGCGPAFVYLFIEALADGGVACGLPRLKAMEYAAQTVLGAAAMVLTTGQHPGALKDAVCSPAGTTIAGVHALEEGAFRATSANAILAAYRRTMEMKK